LGIRKTIKKQKLPKVTTTEMEFS